MDETHINWIELRTDVAVFLRQGAFYESLQGSDNLVPIPSLYNKEDTLIDSCDALHHLLSSLQFWGVDEIPDEIYRYCLSKDTIAFDVSDFSDQLTCLRIIAQVKELSENVDRMALVAANGHLQFLKFMIEQLHYEVNSSVMLAAARSGQLSIMKYLNEEVKAPWHPWTLNAAILHGQKDSVLCRLGPSLRDEFLVYSDTESQNAHSSCQANDPSSAGQEKIQKSSPTTVQTCSPNQQCGTIPSQRADGYFGCFKYALQEDGCPKDLFVSHYAAGSGQINCLVYARSTARCYWNSLTAACAAEGGHLACLQLLYERYCPWDALTCTLAAKEGHLDCLEFAVEHLCPWDVNTCIEAAGSNHLECLMFAHEHGCPWNAAVCAEAASNGHIITLDYAYHYGCPWDETTCIYAAEHNQLACLHFAVSRGCPKDTTEACTRAAMNGHMECLMYLHQQGFPWDTETCTAAAREGRIDCLVFAYERGCPWDVFTAAAAAGRGHGQCFAFCLLHDCPVDTFTELCASYYPDCAELLKCCS